GHEIPATGQDEIERRSRCFEAAVKTVGETHLSVGVRVDVASVDAFEGPLSAGQRGEPSVERESQVGARGSAYGAGAVVGKSRTLAQLGAGRERNPLCPELQVVEGTHVVELVRCPAEKQLLRLADRVEHQMLETATPRPSLTQLERQSARAGR